MKLEHCEQLGYKQQAAERAQGVVCSFVQTSQNLPLGNVSFH